MIKRLTILLTVIYSCMTFVIYAQQNDKYEKLKDLYVERKYEACLAKSVKFTQNEKTRKDPIPYLYLSKSYYELSLSEDPEIIDYYPKALKNALKFAIKFNQKDKKDVFQELAADHILKLTKKFIEETQKQYDNGKYNTVSVNYKQLLKLIDDNNVRYAKGIADAFNNNASEANMYIKEAIVNLQGNAISSTKINTDYLLINYGVDWSDYLLREEKVDSALSTIDILLSIKPGHHSLTAQKAKIESAIPKEEEVEEEEE